MNALDMYILALLLTMLYLLSAKMAVGHSVTGKGGGVYSYYLPNSLIFVGNQKCNIKQ